jgi:hypothetical protein
MSEAWCCAGFTWLFGRPGSTAHSAFPWLDCRGLTLCAVTAYPDTQNRQESASEQQHSAAAAQQVIELAVNESCAPSFLL